MSRSFLLLLVLTMFAAGCATAHKINKVSLGMTKQEVIYALGRPVSTSAKEGVEYLNYKFSESGDEAFWGVTRSYFVRIVNGEVESYGRLGDFDSTKTPETKSTIDLNIKK